MDDGEKPLLFAFLNKKMLTFTPKYTIMAKNVHKW